LVGCRTIKPEDLASVWRTGVWQKTVLVATFALTLVIPVQYAVLAGVGLSVILHVVRQSNQVTIKRWQFDPTGHLVETDPPASLPANEVVVLQPYGSLSFAAAALEARKLVIVSASERVQDQLQMMGVTELIGSGNIYSTDERVGATLKRAYADAQSWIRDQPAEGTSQR
jgi:SulP family sulfate permease